MKAQPKQFCSEDSSEEITRQASYEKSAFSENIDDKEKGTLEEYILEDDKEGIAEVDDPYRKQMRYKFLPFACLILVGGFFNNTFQAFIKEQFMESMNFSASQYNLFVLIPPLPNIILPIFSGQIFDFLTIRRAMFLFSLMILLGMTICFFSTYNQSLLLMILGKTIHQIGNELLSIGQSAMVTAWFDSQTLAFAFTWGSFVAKLSGSVAGVVFPQLYNINDDLQIPLLVSVSTCLFSFACALVVIYFDKEADKRLGIVTKSKRIVIEFKIFREYTKLFYIYTIQAGLLYGSFYAFESYLHSILVDKFGINKTTAGTMTSIPFWVAFTAPAFGIIADKFGKRVIGLFGTGMIALISVIVLLIFPDSTSEIVLYIPLVIFGLFLSSMAAYLFPVFPLLCNSNQVRTGFGMGYASKNAGLSGFGFLGGMILDSQDSDSYLTFFIGIFSCACLLQVYGYFVDRKAGGNLNSVNPRNKKKAVLLSSRLSRSASLIG